MTAFNIVRFRVNPGREDEFVDVHRTMKADFPGMRSFSVLKTGDRAYCIVGEWESMQSIANARHGMIANLDRMRDLLEDLGNGLGITDPISGEAIVELRP